MAPHRRDIAHGRGKLDAIEQGDVASFAIQKMKATITQSYFSDLWAGCGDFGLGRFYLLRLGRSGRWLDHCLRWRRHSGFRFRRRLGFDGRFPHRYTPFARFVLRPDHRRPNQRDFLNYQRAPKNRAHFDAKAKVFGFQKWRRVSVIELRNGDPAKIQSAPGSDTDALDLQRHLESLAEFLLNPLLCSLRLHIQVCPKQRNEKNRNYDHQKPADGSPEAEHQKTLPSVSTRQIISTNPREPII